MSFTFYILSPFSVIIPSFFCHISLDFSIDIDQRLVFGRGERVTYYLKYTISPVYYSYHFALNQVDCLHTSSPLGLRDHLTAVVEFNHSPHQIDNGPISTYDLGSYSSHDVGPMHTSHNHILLYFCVHVHFFRILFGFKSILDFCTRKNILRKLKNRFINIEN